MVQNNLLVEWFIIQVMAPQEHLLDDGPRIVRIIGCEYRLTESEIMEWLSLYGEVISEITEEPFGDEQTYL